ncbi:mycothiol transferase [Streptomyces chattanoogensis]|uniref:mycothiol transferase n=1 Tax=Streptomyces chattanoogensis TaxID=66876 RepID=UPI00368032D6
MTASTDLLVDAFGRIRETVDDVLSGLGTDELAARLDDDANSIGWLVWHLTRIQDDHIADAAGTEQIWTSQGWYERFGLPFADFDTGFGHSSDDVAAVQGIGRQLLNGYHEAVHDNTVRYLKGLHVKDLEEIVDQGWAPPVTLGVRLISVISDDLQHVGQAAFIRGVLRRG